MFVSTGQGVLGYNMFAYCRNNPIAQTDENGEFGLFTLCVIGAATNALIAYAGDVIQNYKSGMSGSEAWTDVNWGGVAAAGFSGAISAIPGGGLAATVVDVIGSATIEEGVNCLVEGRKWDMQKWEKSVANNTVCAVISSQTGLSEDVPQFLRDIKGEAREMGIKGANRLNKYLNLKQALIIGQNGFYSDMLSRLV